MSADSVALVPPLNTVERWRLEGRFWTKARRDGDCWRWRAGSMSHGYGCFHIQGRALYAHRVAYLLTYGHLPEKGSICHRCDHPWCINPAHLFAGSQADNLADMARKGRSARGERNAHARLTAEDVAEIRRLSRMSHVTQAELARRFGVQRPAISRIISGTRWGDVS
jgi:predicted XRE-type DNA-binding protein